MASIETYGRGAWVYLLAVAGAATTQEARDNVVKWLRLTPLIFPCRTCSEHLEQTFKSYPPERFADSAERMLKLVYILKDAANHNWNASHPTLPRKCSPPFSEIIEQFLAIPTPEEDNSPPQPLLRQAPSASASASAPRHQLSFGAPHSSRMTVSAPMFEQLKSSFSAQRRWH